jgi:hypothetical protein
MKEPALVKPVFWIHQLLVYFLEERKNAPHYSAKDSLEAGTILGNTLRTKPYLNNLAIVKNIFS